MITSALQHFTLSCFGNCSFKSTQSARRMSNESTEKRSSSGCWTCRLRRKKCDEARPRCTSCNLLQISCFGYGPKPDWMDGGNMERAVAKATLDAVRQTTARNRRSRRSQNLSNSTVSCNASTASILPVTKIRHTDVFPTEAGRDPEFYEDMMQDITTSTPLPPLAVDLFGSSNDSESLALHKFAPSSSPSKSSPDKDARKLSQISYMFPAGFEEKGISSIMDYMDSVFFLQFPLHGPLPTVGGRGWLLWMLIHVRPFQIITDALCTQCHRSLHFPPTRIRSDNTHENEVDKISSLLLSELNQYIDRVSLQDSEFREGKIDILVCTIQLIFLEVFQGESLMWRTHLQAASSLVAFLASHSSCSNQDTNIIYSAVYCSAFRFFTGLFIWFDVISAASMGTKHLLQDEDERLLETNEVDLGALVGCDNWIVLTILKTTALYHWKQERERDGKLSLAELVRRSEPLERRLKQSLSKPPNSMYQSMISGDPSSIYGNSQRDIITRIFVGSTLSYLHFVVSGPHPELVEMRESVTMTIEAFKKLPHPWLLRSLAWSFCVTGCFALPEERSLLRNLVTVARVDGPTGGSLGKALEVVEQCWKMQDSSLGLYDWRKAASSLGYDTLFI
ncbi:fungal-specific transcription factor domain-containing protein [Bisporella sp. PMI_857]|nr:fungal-specific transcription factor domain-containing protein [Bisporella sp. PMI_857]